MTKADLVSKVAEKTCLTKKDSETAVAAVFEGISEALESGEKLTVVGFGTFEVRERAARDGVNPQTKEKIKIPATRVPAFKAGKTLKDAVANAKKSKKK